ncbi:hypothetical protein [Pararhodobacter sp.]|uniref:hypothetical protein n=1 Tax=Pararhodobacter sp. TaxID=2127056 RepID=UPI002AFE2365|nr:hypothetical protein [Pararhodobacter sp.]
MLREDAAGAYRELRRIGDIQDPAELADVYEQLIGSIERAVAENGALNETQEAYRQGLIEAQKLALRLVAIDENRGQWDNARAQDMLAELGIQQAINEHGEDSRQVTVLRAAAERDAFDETLRTLDISDELRDELSAAWDAAKGLGATDMASAVARARTEATAMADEITRALGAVQALAQSSVTSLDDARIRSQYTDPVDQAYQLSLARVRRAQAPVRENAAMDPIVLAGLDAQAEAIARNEAEAVRLTEAQRALASGSRNAGRASDQHRDAVSDLIAELNDEIAILREADPVQQEMLRHREVLASATAAERAQVEELIRTRIDENAVLEENQRQMEAARDLGNDVLRGIISDLREGASAGDILANALDKILDKLLDMSTTSLTDALFGNSTGGGGGFLSSLLNSLFGIKPHAMGDVVGSPTLFAYGDKPGQLGVMGEAGPEAIMPLTHAGGSGVGAMLDGREVTLGLTRLSSGKLGVSIPSNLTATPFAQGGSFGFVPSAPAGSGGQPANISSPVIQLQPVLVNNTSRQVDLDVEETTDARGQRQQRFIISDLVGDGLATPGGKAARTMQSRYNTRPSARRRS